MSEIKKFIQKQEFNVGTEFGVLTENIGGFNYLNIPDELANQSADFFNQYNKPWLEKAILRGDDIILATRPVNIGDYISPEGKLLGMYARELRYLVEMNYCPKNMTKAEWSTVKKWFNNE